MNKCHNCGDPFMPPATDDLDSERCCPFCRSMRNKAMARKLRSGQAVDVAAFQRTPEGDYILPDYADHMDYCDSKTEEWIWSIGQQIPTRLILASTTNKFYQNPNCFCLWLR